MIETYFWEIEQAISYFKNILTYNLYSKVYNDKQGFIKGKITFNDKKVLLFSEVKDIEISSKIKYRYHYMEENKSLIFRYDNAKHHKSIASFPFHKHIKNEVSESKEVSLYDVLLEISKFNRE